MSGLPDMEKGNVFDTFPFFILKPTPPNAIRSTHHTRWNSRRQQIRLNQTPSTTTEKVRTKKPVRQHT